MLSRTTKLALGFLAALSVLLLIPLGINVKVAEPRLDVTLNGLGFAHKI